MCCGWSKWSGTRSTHLRGAACVRVRLGSRVEIGVEGVTCARNRLQTDTSTLTPSATRLHQRCPLALRPSFLDTPPLHHRVHRSPSATRGPLYHVPLSPVPTRTLSRHSQSRPLPVLCTFSRVIPSCSKQTSTQNASRSHGVDLSDRDQSGHVLLCDCQCILSKESILPIGGVHHQIKCFHCK